MQPSPPDQPRAPARGGRAARSTPGHRPSPRGADRSADDPDLPPTAFHEAPATERALRRALPPALAWAGAAGLVAMSAFHLYTGTFGSYPTPIQLSIHLAFALALAFALFPAAQRLRHPALTAVDLLLAALGVACALYVAVNHNALSQRIGSPTPLDLAVAIAAIGLILEATRRSISKVLFYITLGFLLFGLLGHLLPSPLGHRQVGFTSLVNYLYLTLNNGVFDTPLRVSATFVFLFVLFGAVLERSGAGRYLIDLAFAAMGRYRGGPAKAAVVASGLMGTVSGSSIANTVSTGSMTIPMMKKAGFKPHVAGAVEVAASTNGQLMPPVMGAAAFIMAEMAVDPATGRGIPYATIVVAALLPALLSYIAIFTMIHLEALRTGMPPGDRAALPAFWRTILRGLHLNIPLIALIVLLLGLPEAVRQPIRDGLGLDLARRTPTTAASYTIWITFALFLVVCLVATASAYGMTIAATTWSGGPDAGATDGLSTRAAARTAAHARTLPRRAWHFVVRVGQAFRDGALNMVGIACACACCGIIIGVVAQTGLGAKLVDLIQTLSGGALVPALVLTALASILLGIGLPTTATYIIMASLTVPALTQIAQANGYEITLALVLAMHLFVFYYGILADDTPPVGLCAYAAAGIAGADPIRTGLTSFRFDLAAFLLPMIFFFNTELLLMDVTAAQVMWVLPGAITGMICFAIALQGYAMGHLRWWERVAFAAIAFLLVKPGLYVTTGGFGLLAVLAVHRLLARRRATAAH
ncbi:MAG: TRAP transporter fused permease subunit [Phycisphaeraceae bacterium]